MTAAGGATADNWALLGDLGGTNARFARREADGSIRDPRNLACADYADPAAAAEAYLATQSGRPRVASLSIASPDRGDRVTMTNSGWEFSAAETRERLGLDALHLLNDFSAQALAVTGLDTGERIPIGGGAPEDGAPIGVIGAGTGLGVSGLVPCHGEWIALRSEGGHVGFSPESPREAAVHQLLIDEFGRVSAELLVSGPGIERLYACLARLDGIDGPCPDAATITSPARRESDPLAGEATALFCAFLGSVAGDLALTLGAFGGVYVSGGIAPQLGSTFVASDFRRRFEGKGRLSTMMAAVPTYLVTADHMGLRGAAVHLARQERERQAA
ncbi:glucokinase [Oceanibacterium hippocampi]|uniref:Glucokinase n=1 Tax=Oceanibacterium hippocampi TaxID=745714 RepID=A0A1Y5U1S3_9PROT|nr:glucokinase [Oceanibacterium hippocampi]SLN74796.1 Glucokinase [Oceanibacterium hippocampi]